VGIQPQRQIIFMSVDIVQVRLHNQHLSQPTLAQPAGVVRHFAAVQSQDYAGAKWGLGLRMKDATDAVLDQAFNEGRILRTHILRPTWHFVAPEDIRWILALSAPRVHAVNAFMYRQLELDRAVIRKSYTVLEKTLRDDKQLTRAELGSAFQQAGIVAQGPRLGYFMMSAELDGIVCSGARRGKQFTYALLEERVPDAKPLPREESLAELTRRYFSTRGPATLQDFTWWSGLTMADARQGIEMVKRLFAKEEVGGNTYWFDGSVMPKKRKSITGHLLPNYDEYYIGLKDRSAIGKLVSPLHPEENSVALNAHIIIVNGQIVGGWRRELKKNKVTVQLRLLTTLEGAQREAVIEAANQYGSYLGLDVELLI
jgi:hypothetical protein